jgi:hypothetical protein
LTDFSAKENDFGCIQNQPLDKCKQIIQFIAHENGFGCIQNQPLDKCKQIIQFIAHENGFECIQNQPCRKMQINCPTCPKLSQRNANQFADFSNSLILQFLGIGFGRI